MTDAWLDDDDLGSDDSPTPKDLRKQIAALNRKVKALQGVVEEKDETINELTGKVKATSLRDLLVAEGIDPKFAKIANRDGVEATAEAVKAWRKENDGIYAFKPLKPADESGDSDEGDEAVDEIPADLADSVQQGQDLEGAGRPSGSQTITDALEAARQNPGQFKTEAEVDAYLRKMGAPNLASLGGYSVEE